MKKFYSLSLILLIMGINWTFSQTLTAVTMPSWTTNHNQGNAIVNQPVTVWGAMFGDDISNYQVMLCIDNVVVTSTPAATSGTYANTHYIEYSYTPTEAGCKKITFKVVVTANDTLISESYIKVFNTNDPSIDTIIVNTMIEKGLLFFFKNAMLVSANNVEWPSNGSSWANTAMETYAATCAAVLAFEEQGHLYGNGLQMDPYADLVQSGLNNIFTYAGINCLLNGVWGVSTSTYVNGLGLTAIIMAQPNARVAKTEVNSIVNKTYYTFDSIAVQSIYANQGSGNGGGGCWHYELDATDDHNYDGSTQQWPMLVFLAAQQRYNMPLVATYVDNGISCYVDNVCSAGGAPYGINCGTDENMGLTGGMLASFGLVNKYYETDANALKAMTYIMNNFNDLGYNTGWSGHTGWPGSLYHAYGLKKGLYIQQHNTLTPFTINGTTIDWYANIAAWLTGEKAFALNPTLKANNAGMLSTTYSYGQNPNGSWQEYALLTDNSWYLSTAFAILTLSRNMFQEAKNTVTPVQLSMCKGDSVQLKASAGNFFDWYPTSHLHYYNVEEPWASPDTTTTYYVTGLDASYCPLTDTAYTVNIVNKFPISFTPDTFFVCPNTKLSLTPVAGTKVAVDYTWSPPMYLSSTTGKTVICKPTSDSLSSITYKVIGTTVSSCTGEDSVTINIKPIPVLAITKNPDTICKGDSSKIIFTITKGHKPFLYKWSKDSLTTENTISTITVTPTITTTYTVTLTDTNSCADINKFNIIVKPSPKPTITGTAISCVGAQRIMYVSDAGKANYIWHVSSGGHITINNGSSILVFWTKVGKDTVEVSYTNSNGCSGTTPLIVTVNPLPATPTITQEGNKLVSSSVTGNQWYDSNGAINGDTLSTFTPPGNGTYYDIVTQDSCPSLPSNNIVLGIPSSFSNPNNLIKIYPNPAKDVIYIELLSDNYNFKNLAISLYDIEGKELLNIPFYNLQKIQISTKELVKGVYYLKIYNDKIVVFNKLLII